MNSAVEEKELSDQDAFRAIGMRAIKPDEICACSGGVPSGGGIGRMEGLQETTAKIVDAKGTLVAI